MTQTTARVGDVAEQIRGVSYPKGDSSSEPGPGLVPILRAGNITDHGLTLEDLVYVPERCVSQRQRVREHDVLVAASSGSLSVVGKTAAANRDLDAAFGAFCKVLRPLPSIDPGYFRHFFLTPDYRRRVSAAAAGANINNLRGSDLDDLEIPLLPIDEQRRIAAVLDQADALRTKRREALDLLDTLAESIFLDMFGDSRMRDPEWPTVELSEIATFFAGGSLPTGEPWANQLGGYLMAKVSDLNLDGNERLLHRTNLWSEHPGARSATSPAGAVVVPKRGGAIGTNKKRLTTRPTVLDPNLMAIWPDADRVSASWLYQWFRMFDLLSIVSGSSIPQLNKQDLAPLKLSLPPLEAQHEFDERVREIDALRTDAERSAERLDELFASLQHRAFRGEL